MQQHTLYGRHMHSRTSGNIWIIFWKLVTHWKIEIMMSNWLNPTYQHSLVTTVDLAKETTRIIFHLVESHIDEVLNLVSWKRSCESPPLKRKELFKQRVFLTYSWKRNMEINIHFMKRIPYIMGEIRIENVDFFVNL